MQTASICGHTWLSSAELACSGAADPRCCCSNNVLFCAFEPDVATDKLLVDDDDEVAGSSARTARAIEPDAAGEHRNKADARVSDAVHERRHQCDPDGCMRWRLHVPTSVGASKRVYLGAQHISASTTLADLSCKAGARQEEESVTNMDTR